MNKNDVYKCNICGNIVTISHVGGGKLVCCEKAMLQMPKQTADQTLEKHVPIIEKTENGIKVIIGSTEHPMEETHYIERIEVIANDGKVYRKYLEPNQKPEVEFPIHDENIIVREYCNLHGLRKTE